MDKLERAAAERYPWFGAAPASIWEQRDAYIQGRLDQAEADAQIAESNPGAVTDALLARVSLPVLDVEKVARFLYSLDPAIQMWNGDPYAYNEPNA
ncbi:MAG TPA: hypothetical protein VL043_11840, partial [Protaetiibacter sp.]|nr:hypothetical protein [Protaetiibacter sp.]